MPLVPLFAQQKETIISPEIHKGNTVTFRLLAPKASSVKLKGSWMTGNAPKVDMVKSDSIWSYTTGKLAADMYRYNFYLEGVEILDPVNSFVERAGVRHENIVIVPGERTSTYPVNDIPHGTLSKVWYDSPSLGMKRRMYVYTPPSYLESDKKYPVLYLLHGAGGDENSWTALGRAPSILDNLIEKGLAEEMIVVMTNGNPWQAASPNAAPFKENAEKADFAEMGKQRFEKSLVNDVIPFIEKRYKTFTDKNKRAITGLSMGGFQTQNITNAHPEMFDYIGVMSMGLLNNPKLIAITYDAEKHTKQIKELSKSNPKLYWLACGTDDFLYDAVTKLREKYDDEGFKYTYRESDGGHTWSNWSLYLTEIVPMLFK